VALTFDACQTRKATGYDAEIVRILQETHTPATFFLGGRWMETHAEATRQLAQEPLFELGNHSYLHPHLRRLTEEQIRAELTKTQAILLRLTGRQGRLFRAPYGEYDERVLRIAAEEGLVTVQWEVVSGDPDRGATADRLIRAVVPRCQNGSIIIMHVNGRGWHTAEALPEIIRRLHKAGFQFVTVSDLLASE
jgi:peptidoglycan/xylan/chitin deacetylase (PgdA/CDA1 family)